MDLNKLYNKNNNIYSKVLFVLGCLVTGGGVLSSFILGSATATYYDDFNWTVFFAVLFAAAISGFTILGLAEIINILNDNRRLLASIAQSTQFGGVINKAEDNRIISTTQQMKPQVSVPRQTTLPNSSIVYKDPIARHKTCPVCGCENNNSAVICTNCGNMLL